MADKSCEERILDQLNSRVSDFGALTDLAGAYDQARLGEVLEDRATRAMFDELTDGADLDGLSLRQIEDLNESARERINEYPLGVSSYTTFRVDLSTGGPGDWLEVICSGGAPAYEGGGDAYEIDRIVYHFADWFDHAERELEGYDLDRAKAFVSEVVPELVD